MQRNKQEPQRYAGVLNFGKGISCSIVRKSKTEYWKNDINNICP
jgi:hypothetical protein